VGILERILPAADVKACADEDTFPGRRLQRWPAGCIRLVLCPGSRSA